MDSNRAPDGRYVLVMRMYAGSFVHQTDKTKGKRRMRLLPSHQLFRCLPKGYGAVATVVGAGDIRQRLRYHLLNVSVVCCHESKQFGGCLGCHYLRWQWGTDRQGVCTLQASSREGADATLRCATLGSERPLGHQ